VGPHDDEPRPQLVTIDHRALRLGPGVDEEAWGGFYNPSLEMNIIL
jgi:hypothetical protein